MAKTTFPGESPEYRAARDRLLEREKELRRATEAVAVARRELPRGGVVPEDYVFHGAGADGKPAEVRMSELFAPGKGSLVIYNFMYGPDMKQPCPGCTSVLDPLDGAAEHLSQRVNLVIVARSPLPRILANAKERGYRHLRFLSSEGNTYNRDYHGEKADGSQEPMLNVFQKDGGEIRHFWGSELLYEPAEPGQHMRHVDSLCPIWNMLDFTPEGRGTDWFPKLRYP